MKASFCRKNYLFDFPEKEVFSFDILLWWITRLILFFCLIKNEKTAVNLILYTVSLLMTFSVDLLRLIFPLLNISFRLQSFISALLLLSTAGGFGFSLTEKIPGYGILLQLAGGIFSGALGYYIISAFRKPEKKNDFTFTAFFTLCFSGTVTVLRKLTEFFIDFYFGTNLCRTDFVSDNHWLYRIFGFGMSPYEQRPLLDTDEDFIFSLMGGILSALTVYLKFRLRNKERFIRKKRNLREFIKNLPERCKAKIFLEIRKVREQTNIWDILFWWTVRFSMLYAFAVMENRAEATLLFANLVGTFTITLIHLLFSESSVLCKISYKVQSLITVMVFLGSYCGNYCFIYGIYGRFDLFLHFVSGFLCFFGGYYIALTLIKAETVKDKILIALFSLCFSFFIMPAWEVSEFIGDFIFGTSNQGFYWGPSDESFFFKLFGYGAERKELYYLFDTIYDMLLAILSTALSFIAFLVFPLRKRKSSLSSSKKEALAC